eukprot:gene645-1247_t
MSKSMKDFSEAEINKQKREGLAAVISNNFTRYVIQEGKKRAAIALGPKVLSRKDYVKSRKRNFQAIKPRRYQKKIPVSELLDESDCINIPDYVDKSIQPYHEFDEEKRIEYDSLTYSRNYDQKVYRDAMQYLNEDRVQYKNVIKIDLSGQYVGNVGLIQLTESFLQTPQPIESLVLSENGIDDTGIKEFSTCLQMLTNLKELYLNQNNITDNGIETIFSPAVYSTSLQVLNLSRNPVWTRTAYLVAMMFTPRRQSQLHSIFFGEKVGKLNLGDDFVHTLVAVLTSPGARPVKRLSCPSAGLSDDGMLSIAALVASTAIEELNISRNALVSPFAKKVLRLALEINNTLTAVQIHDCGLTGREVHQHSLLVTRRHVKLPWHISTLMTNTVLRQLGCCDNMRRAIEHDLVNVRAAPARRLKPVIPTRFMQGVKPLLTRKRYEQEMSMIYDNDEIPFVVTVIPYVHPICFFVDGFAMGQIMETQDMLSDKLAIDTDDLIMDDDSASLDSTSLPQAKVMSRRLSTLLPDHSSLSLTGNAAGTDAVLGRTHSTRDKRIGYTSSQSSSFGKDKPPLQSSTSSRGMRGSIYLPTTNTSTTSTSASTKEKRGSYAFAPLSAKLERTNSSINRRSSTNFSQEMPVVMSESGEITFTPKYYDLSMPALNKALKRSSLLMRQGSVVTPSLYIPSDGFGNSDQVSDTPSRRRSSVSSARRDSVLQATSSPGQSGKERRFSVSDIKALQLPTISDNRRNLLVQKAAVELQENLDVEALSVMMSLVTVALDSCEKFMPWLRDVENVMMETMLASLRDLALSVDEQMSFRKSKTHTNIRRRQSKNIKSSMQITLNKLCTQVRAKVAAAEMEMISVTALDNYVSFDIALMSIEDYLSSLLEQSQPFERGIAMAHKYRLQRLVEAAKETSGGGVGVGVNYSIWMPYVDILGDAAYFSHQYFAARPFQDEEERRQALAEQEAETKRENSVPRKVRLTADERKKLTKERNEKLNKDLVGNRRRLLLDGPPLIQTQTHAMSHTVPQKQHSISQPKAHVQGMLSKILEESSSLDTISRPDNNFMQTQSAISESLYDIPFASSIKALAAMSSDDNIAHDPFLFRGSDSFSLERPGGLGGGGGASSQSSISLANSTGSAGLGHNDHPFGFDELPFSLPIVAMQYGLRSVYVRSFRGTGGDDDSDEDVEVRKKKKTRLVPGRKDRRYLVRSGCREAIPVILEEEEMRGRSFPITLKLNYFRKEILMEQRFKRHLEKREKYYKSCDAEY